MSDIKGIWGSVIRTGVIQQYGRTEIMLQVDPQQMTTRAWLDPTAARELAAALVAAADELEGRG